MPTVFVANKEKKTRHRMGPLTSFALHPDHVRFETQEAKEEVILFLRQHIIVNVPWLVFTVVLLIIPAFLFPAIQQAITVPTQYVVIATLFWYLATAGFAISSFIGWFFNIYIVTDDRIVDIDFLYLLYKHFSEADLTKIQDISYTSGGILATLFNYGNITVETAGEMPNLEFLAVPTPEKVVATIRSLIEAKEVKP